VHLTAREYQMLELLSLRKGMALTKEMFLNHRYGGVDEPEPTCFCRQAPTRESASNEH
jgi:DNA-binding response OmpR family regulator